jgi:hypothetical protein
MGNISFSEVFKGGRLFFKALLTSWFTAAGPQPQRTENVFKGFINNLSVLTLRFTRERSGKPHVLQNHEARAELAEIQMRRLSALDVLTPLHLKGAEVFCYLDARPK